MADESQAAEPRPAPPTEAAPSKYVALVEAWFDRHFRNPAITRSVEAWNVAQAAKNDLIATLQAGG